MPKLEVVNANNVIEFNPQKANFKLKNTGGPKGDTGAQGPQGPKGETGAQGPAGASASVTVGSTTTLSPGADATVTNSGDTRNAILNFGIPTGARGPKGDTGSKGDTGPIGPKGAKGDTGAAATVQVGNTNTGAPGTNAQVTNAGNEHFAVFNFTIPRGDKGEKGATGAQGPKGPAGQDGTDGFSPIATVTQEGLDAEISITDKDGTTTATVPGFGVQVVESLPSTGSPNVIYLERDSNSASGNPISIADAVEAPLKSLEIQGNTTQQTYSGKNLVYTSGKTDGGITATYNAATGETTISGTAQRTYAVFGMVVDVFPAGTYTFSIQSAAPCSVGVATRTSGGTRQGHAISAGATNTTFTISEDSPRYDIYLTNLTVDTTYNFTFKAMLESGSSATSFEPYVGGTASPNPDYPQAVQTVTGENVVKICGKNLFDIGASLNEWFQTFSNGLAINSYSVNRTTATISGGKLTVDSYDATGWTWISKWVLLEKNTSYIISGKNTQAMKIVGFNSKELSTAGTLIVVKNKAPDGGTTTFDTGDYNYYAISFYPNGENEYFEDVQIEKGSTTATAYEPYQGQSYEVNLGKNLAKMANGAYSYSEADQTFTLLDGSITTTRTNGSYQGGAINISTGALSRWTKNCASDSHLTGSGGTYTLTFSRTGDVVSSSSPRACIYGFIYDNDGNNTSGNGQLLVDLSSQTSGTYTLNLAADRHLGALVFYSQYISYSDVEFKVQLEKGSTPTSYAAYFEPIELCKIGDYQDYIYKSGGKWYVHKEVGKILSYAGETISTDYISTTGSLTTGATIYYVLATPTDTEITNEALIAQLEAILAGGTQAGANTITLTPSAGATGTLEVEYYDSYDSYLWVNNRWEKFAHLG